MPRRNNPLVELTSMTNVQASLPASIELPGAINVSLSPLKHEMPWKFEPDAPDSMIKDKKEETGNWPDGLNAQRMNRSKSESLVSFKQSTQRAADAKKPKEPTRK